MNSTVLINVIGKKITYRIKRKYQILTNAWINRIAAFLMVGALLFVVLKRYVFDQNKLDSNHRFSVATIYNISYPVEGGPIAKFQYCINQVVYKNYKSFNSFKQKISIGDKFLLKYYPPDPNIARILLDKPLDSLLILKMHLDTCRGQQ